MNRNEDESAVRDERVSRRASHLPPREKEERVVLRLNDKRVKSSLPNILLSPHRLPLPPLLLHHQQALPGPPLARRGEAAGHVQDQSDIPGGR